MILSASRNRPHTNTQIQEEIKMMYFSLVFHGSSSWILSSNSCVFSRRLTTSTFKVGTCSLRLTMSNSINNLCSRGTKTNLSAYVHEVLSSHHGLGNERKPHLPSWPKLRRNNPKKFPWKCSSEWEHLHVVFPI